MINPPIPPPFAATHQPAAKGGGSHSTPMPHLAPEVGFSLEQEAKEGGRRVA
ncbi:hypothetical protein GCM10012275_40440 [Longimycelium tulufanense]|uniref:Uncharacterized protein n=1 Tax=Longimycelium tulufanense TaxID=907463 RepID=A0A8J3CIB8_9PSEU|nr:hypothetical protein GCM10012275_40440 [Longimycelium tulufanense]